MVNCLLLLMSNHFRNVMIWNHPTWNFSATFQFDDIGWFSFESFSFISGGDIMLLNRIRYMPSSIYPKDFPMPSTISHLISTAQTRVVILLGFQTPGSLGVSAIIKHQFSQYGCFLKWWYPPNTPKGSFLVGKPMVVGYPHMDFNHPNWWIPLSEHGKCKIYEMLIYPFEPSFQQRSMGFRGHAFFFGSPVKSNELEGSRHPAQVLFVLKTGTTSKLAIQLSSYSVSGWWLNPTHLKKYAQSSNWKSSANFWVTKKYIRDHHLGVVLLIKKTFQAVHGCVYGYLSLWESGKWYMKSY